MSATNRPCFSATRRQVLSNSLVALGGIALGHQRSIAQGVGAQGNTLRWVQVSATGLSSFDPASPNTVMRHVYESLVSLKPPEFLDIEPALATAWRLIDPLTWEFELRQGVQFHDGSAFTADDVVFSFNRFKSVSSTRLPRVAAIEAVGKSVVRFRTSGPDLSFPYVIRNIVVVSRAWSESHGAVAPPPIGQVGYASTNANGTGPFALESFEPGMVTVARNSTWWGREQYPHNVDRMEFRRIADAQARFSAVLGGQVDLLVDIPLDIPAQDLERLKSAPGMRLEQGPEGFTTYLGLNQVADELRSSRVRGSNPFRDLRVRQAINRAIDVDAIIKDVMRGFARPAGILIERPTIGYSSELDRRPPHDPGIAKQLLAAAGFATGFEVTLVAASDSGGNAVQIAYPLAEQLARVGLRVTVETPTNAELGRRLTSREIDFYVASLSDGASPDGWTTMNFLFGPDSLHKHDRIRELVKAIPTEPVTYSRDGMIEEVWRAATNELAVIPLHHRDVAVLVRDRLKIPHPLQRHMWLARFL